MQFHPNKGGVEMPRVNRVAKARKAQGSCGKCHKTIAAGDPYIWVKPRYGGKRVRCTDPRCRFRPSELTSSEIRSEIYSAQEDWEDNGGPLNVDLARDVVESLRNVVEMIQEKLDNIESGFGHTDLPVYEELESRKDDLEAWVDEGEGFADEAASLADELNELRDNGPEEVEVSYPDRSAYEDDSGFDEEAYEAACQEAEEDAEAENEALEQAWDDEVEEKEQELEAAIANFESWLDECPE